VDDNHAVQAMNGGLKGKGPKLVTTFSVAETPAADSDVIKRAQKGDADAFAALFHAHKARIFEVQGYDHQEIAEMLGCCAGNSKSQLHKAKLRIRERLALSPKAGSGTIRVGGSLAEPAGPLFAKCGLSIGRSEERSRHQVFSAIDTDEMATGRQDELPKASSSAQRDFLG